MTKNEDQALLRRAEEILPEIIAWRRAIHAYPELRMETPVTEAFIVKTLREIGITDIRSGVGGHGVAAVIEGGLPGKCLGIRADCDGLPIEEQTGLPFASKNGNMHACGHDAHTAMALGAAKLLYENRHLLRGRVKLIFQPYEEGDGGAKRMLADGVMENPAVDAVIGLHNNCTPVEEYQPGEILASPEPASCNIFAYEATFFGDNGHVCLSRSLSSSVYMACEAVTKIAALPEPGPDTINAVTVVQGGVRNNVLPETCRIEGCVRAYDRALQDEMRIQVENILHETAEKHGGRVEITKTIDVMSTENDRQMYEMFCRIVDSVWPERPCRELVERQMIGEDFSRFADLVPGIYFRLYTKPLCSSYPLHHPKFDVHEPAMSRGSAAFAAFALHWQDEIPTGEETAHLYDGGKNDE